MPSPIPQSPFPGYNGTASPFFMSDRFTDGIAFEPTRRARFSLDGLSQAMVVTGMGTTVTNNGSATSVALNNIGGRPCGAYTSAASATSGLNVQVPAASIIPQANKRIWIDCSVRFVTSIGTTFAFGLSTLNTNFANADSADQIKLSKASAAAAWKLSCVNNTGTAETVLVPNFTIAADKWNDMRLEVIDSGTAGIGTINVYGLIAGVPGAASTLLLSYTTLTQFPDRTAGPLAPVWSGISGDGSANQVGVSNFDVQLEA